ncbi:MAG: hypothetical protein BGN98_06025 [Microbacterium sp. 69-7]|nr:MAG: hypothetical protein BGN98_06025 [Microbacterium sp. 69-7]
MLLDGTLAEPEPTGDLGIAQSGRDQPGDLCLARAEMRRGILVADRREQGSEVDTRAQPQDGQHLGGVGLHGAQRQKSQPRDRGVAVPFRHQRRDLALP